MSSYSKHRRAFTLIELIAVIVVLAILAGVALPKVLDLGDDAERSAADGSISAVQTALHQAFVDHRANDATNGEWITSINDVASVMQFDQLPEGLVIDGTTIIDQTGATWDFTPETDTEPARLTLDESGGGGAGPGAGGSGGGSAA